MIHALAHQLGKSPATIRDYISGHEPLGPKVAAIVAGLKAAGEHSRAERLLKPIREAMRGVQHPAFTAQLLVQHSTAEGDSNTALVDFVCDPHSIPKLRAAIREHDIESALDTEIGAALRALLDEMLAAAPASPMRGA